MMMYDLCRIRERKFGFALLMRRKTMDNKPYFQTYLHFIHIGDSLKPIVGLGLCIQK